MFQKIVLIICSFILGIGSAIGGLFLLGYAPIRFDNPLLTIFGVRKPEVIGFQPYWLLSQADKQYALYITTLTYFGLTIDRDGSLIKLSNPGEEEPGWSALRSSKYDGHLLEAKKQGLKQSLLVVNGDDSVIADMIRDPEASAKNLVRDAAPIMRDKGFTDLNLDVEGFADASESARTNFTAFVRTIKNELSVQKLGTLTLDLIPIALVKPKLYDATALGTFADRVVLMTYDYHYLGGLTSGAVAPVGGAGRNLEFDVETAVKEALKVMPREKIVLGIPLYGYEWETIKRTHEAATIPGGASTASTRRIAELVSGCATCSSVMDPVSREPYLILPENGYFNQFDYENEVSVNDKIALAKKYHLGGIALWALGYEDSTILRPLASYKKSFALPFPY